MTLATFFQMPKFFGAHGMAMATSIFDSVGVALHFMDSNSDVYTYTDVLVCSCL